MGKEFIKIFVTGFFNAGKTTMIQNLDENAMSIEKKLSTPYNEEKTHTTTGFDLGKMVWARPNLDPQTKGILMSQAEFRRDKEEFEGWHFINVQLKGSPGQAQFSSVREVLSKGSDGIIFLIDGCDMGNIGNALTILEETKANLGEDTPIRLIANKSDREDYCGADTISDYVGDTAYKGSALCNIGIKDAIIDLLNQIRKESSYCNSSEIIKSIKGT